MSLQNQMARRTLAQTGRAVVQRPVNFSGTGQFPTAGPNDNQQKTINSSPQQAGQGGYSSPQGSQQPPQQTQPVAPVKTVQPQPTYAGGTNAPPPQGTFNPAAMNRAFAARMPGSGNAWDLHPVAYKAPTWVDKPAPAYHGSPSDNEQWNDKVNNLETVVSAFNQPGAAWGPGGATEIDHSKFRMAGQQGSTTGTGQLAGTHTAIGAGSPTQAGGQGSVMPQTAPAPSPQTAPQQQSEPVEGQSPVVQGQNMYAIAPAGSGGTDQQANSSMTPYEQFKDFLNRYSPGSQHRDAPGFPGSGASGSGNSMEDFLNMLGGKAGGAVGAAASGMADAFNNKSRKGMEDWYNNFSDLDQSNELAKRLMDPEYQAQQEEAAKQQLRSDVNFNTDRQLRMNAAHAAAGGRMGGGSTQAAYDSANKSIEDGQRKLIQDAFQRKLAAGQLGSQISSDRAKQIYDILGSERIKPAEAAAIMAQLFGDVVGAGGNVLSHLPGA